MPTVNTQAQTHAKIHIHAQIPAYVQLPTLFQPHVPLQPRSHLHCNKVPGPATISVDLPVSAKALIITRRLCIISVDGNEAAVFYLLALHTLATRSQPSRKVNPPSSVSTCFLPLLSSVPVSTPLTLTIPMYLTLGHVTLPGQIIIHP